MMGIPWGMSSDSLDPALVSWIRRHRALSTRSTVLIEVSNLQFFNVVFFEMLPPCMRFAMKFQG